MDGSDIGIFQASIIHDVFGEGSDEKEIITMEFARSFCLVAHLSWKTIPFSILSHVNSFDVCPLHKFCKTVC